MSSKLRGLSMLIKLHRILGTSYFGQQINGIVMKAYLKYILIGYNIIDVIIVIIIPIEMFTHYMEFEYTKQVLNLAKNASLMFNVIVLAEACYSLKSIFDSIFLLFYG